MIGQISDDEMSLGSMFRETPPRQSAGGHMATGGGTIDMSFHVDHSRNIAFFTPHTPEQMRTRHAQENDNLGSMVGMQNVKI